ncbi:MAG: ligase-associated DNA damage response exonuclease [Steroidobacteraceae bacterium]
MHENPESLIVSTSRGLYCPPGDFYIDPSRAVRTAVITHGHGDHLRRGHTRYILARPGLGIARSRLRGRPDILAVEYGEPLALRSVRVSLHPAGHILGSAQVRLEHEGRVWVVSGDYKRQPDPTCAALDPLPCDVFVSEATFARPEFRWPPTHEVIGEIRRWWSDNRERGVASVLYCYALGKSQRILSELAAFDDAGPIQLHPSIAELVAVYREAGVRMAPAIAATLDNLKRFRGSLVLVPPHAARTSWIRRVGERSSGLCSGWVSRGSSRTQGCDRGFVLSDHADWPGLVDTCLATGARRVLLMHGSTDTLARYLTEQGIEAGALEDSASRRD